MAPRGRRAEIEWRAKRLFAAAGTGLVWADATIGKPARAYYRALARETIRWREGRRR